MVRGLLKNIIPEEIIKLQKRSWNITLLKSLDIWLEFVFRTEEFNKYKKECKRKILEKLFPKDDFHRFPIYYISIRPRTRFIKHIKCMSKDRKSIRILLIEGFRPSVFSICIEELSSMMGFDNSSSIVIYVQDKYIICNDGKKQMTISVYDLLYLSGYKFKYDNEIFYIGCTKNPDSRPFSAAHAGLAEVLYNEYNRKRHDIFINYQQFHINSIINNKAGLIFQVSNTMLNEINIEKEVKIVESCLIKYYLENKTGNYKREMAYLKNRLDYDLSNRNISSIIFLINYEDSMSMFKYKHNKSKNCIQFEIISKFDTIHIVE